MSLGCPSVAHGIGPAVGLRSIGWEVEVYDGHLCVVPSLKCPRCVSRVGAGIDAATPEGRFFAARDMIAQRVRSLVPESSKRGGALAHGDDGKVCMAFMVMPLDGVLLLVRSVASRDRCEVSDLLLADEAAVSLVVEAALSLGWGPKT